MQFYLLSLSFIEILKNAVFYDTKILRFACSLKKNIHIFNIYWCLEFLLEYSL